MITLAADGKRLAGPFDVYGLLEDVSTGRFHPCIWQEHPLPGEPPSNLVRLKSLGHHNGGFDSYDDAVAHMDQMAREQFVIDPRNVWKDREQIRRIDGSREDFASSFVVARWREP